MKNLFKFGFLALAISLSVAACGGSDKSGAEGDSTAVDSAAVDTSLTTDSMAVDTAAAVTTDSAAAPAH